MESLDAFFRADKLSRDDNSVRSLPEDASIRNIGILD
jgi:hypothetical protein